MARILKERDRILAATARGVGLTTAATALACLSLPGSLPLALSLASLVAIVAMGVAHYRLVSSRPIPWVVAIAALGIVTILIPILPGTQLTLSTICALGLIAGGSIASLAILLIATPRHYGLLAVLFVLSLGAVVLTLQVTGTVAAEPLALTITGWAVCTILGIWLGRTVSRILARITNMSRAYRAERQASETEARRRQGARLLHDTVLATLTLLAHSGVGVSADALRQQAKEDAMLLRQLRLGYTPNPAASGDYKLRQVEESTLGNTLESVKQRFKRMGLEVNWHGTGQVLLQSDILDAFLLALAECLENVRRHSGVSEAHVTITEDDATVRAMVTDAGVGFDLAEIDSGRLGFTESIVARLRDVGGNARLFSSPGSGTTVVLEVPR